MKVVILAGGLGTRISEETSARPKPMVEIGGKPLLWHIMKIYSSQGFHDFVICLGYRGYMIKEYFANYALHMSDVTLDVKKGRMKTHQNLSEPWRVTLVDTGENTMTGGRLKRVATYLGRGPFCLTYGDGVSDVDLRALVAFHRKQRAAATLTAVEAPSRFGKLALRGDKVSQFREKLPGDAGWINGGFFVLEPEALEAIGGDDTRWEEEPLRQLAREGRLAAYRHKGFWYAVDTLRDKMHLDELWAGGRPPWKTWK
ncbi:MAG: glucose-1-phosphate cytidylyltransferase [Elusimicrobia bacterium]|nr:glucose-1-phosphate cytidylyltransferase [Elusimicrobiota bacterium]